MFQEKLVRFSSSKIIVGTLCCVSACFYVHMLRDCSEPITAVQQFKFSINKFPPTVTEQWTHDVSTLSFEETQVENLKFCRFFYVLLLITLLAADSANATSTGSHGTVDSWCQNGFRLNVDVAECFEDLEGAPKVAATQPFCRKRIILRRKLLMIRYDTIR